MGRNGSLMVGKSGILTIYALPVNITPIALFSKDLSGTPEIYERLVT
jgi:hypothetical protein